MHDADKAHPEDGPSSPPVVTTRDGKTAALCTHADSTWNSTGMPSIGLPWASCTWTTNSALSCRRTENGTSKEKKYPEEAVGPISFGVQPMPPTVNVRESTRV